MSVFSLTSRLYPLLILFSGLLLAWLDAGGLRNSEIVLALPYVGAALLIVFAAMFNRSRFISPVVIALLTYHLIRERLQVPLSEPEMMALFTGLNGLFCGQLILAVLWPERGLLNAWGAALMLVLCGSFGLLWQVGLSVESLEWLRAWEVFQAQRLEMAYWMSDGLLYLYAGTFLILLPSLIFRRTPGDLALLLTLLAGFSVFALFSIPNVSAIVFSSLFIALFVLYLQSNFQVTYLDALTGIPGRRALEDDLSALGRKYCIAMLDVDHFKQFNDTHGHDVGDQVLKMVASKVARVEGGGKAFRYGGEEFTIVFRRKSAAEAFVYLEAVRVAIEHYALTLRGQERASNRKAGKALRGQGKTAAVPTVSVTISIGVADRQPGQSPAEVIKAADALLYQAKKAGRNRTQQAAANRGP